MKRLTLAVALLVAGSAVAQIRVEVQLPSIFFPAPPALVVVEPGIQVVSDYDEEVFYVDNFYWHRRGESWYRTNTHNGAWVRIEPRFVPQRLFFYEPGHFRHWHGSDDQRRRWNDWRERHEDRREAREREERFERERMERERFEHERDRETRERYEREQRRDDRRDDRREQRGGYGVPPPSGYAAPPPSGYAAPPPSGNYHGSEPAGEHGSGPAGVPPRKRPSQQQQGPQPVVH